MARRRSRNKDRGSKELTVEAFVVENLRIRSHPDLSDEDFEVVTLSARVDFVDREIMPGDIFIHMKLGDLRRAMGCR